MMRKNHTHTGFTIVELLIVIVVIAILAAISIVAYTGIQEQARETQKRSAANAVQKGLALYFVAHGEYPRVCWDHTVPGDPGSRVLVNYVGMGVHCDISRLERALVPDYMNTIPELSSLPEDSRVQYTSGSYERPSRGGYGLALELDGERTCKILVGATSSGWFDRETEVPLCE